MRQTSKPVEPRERRGPGSGDRPGCARRPRLPRRLTLQWLQNHRLPVECAGQTEIRSVLTAEGEILELRSSVLGMAMPWCLLVRRW